MAVQRVQECLAGHRLGRVAAVVHQLAADHHLVTHLDVRAGCIFLVTQVQDAEGIELGVRIVVLDVEGGVAVGAGLAEGALVGDLADLALHIDVARGLVVVVARPGQVRHGRTGTRDIVWIRGRAGAGRGSFSAATAGTAALGNAVQRVQERLVGRGFRRIAPVIHHPAADYDLVAFGDLGVAVLPAPVAQVLGAVHRKGLVAIRILDHEGAVSVLGGVSLADGRDITLDVHVLRALHVGAQGADVRQHARDGERILQRAGALGLRPLRTGLEQRHGCVGFQADGQEQGARPVIGLVGQHRDVDPLRRGRGAAVIGIDGGPLGHALDHPVAGGHQFYRHLRTGGELDGFRPHFQAGQHVIFILPAS